MAFSAKAGSIASPSATGNQSTTGVGFQPKLILFVATALTADGLASLGHTFFGAAVSATVRFAIDENGDTGYSTHSNAKCFVSSGSGGALIIAADLVSMDADGFTINWTTVSSGIVVNYIALGGADLTNVAITQITSPTSTGNQATTGVGFKPDAVILATIGQATAPPATILADTPFGLGAMTATAQGTATRVFDTARRSYQRTSSAIAALISGAVGLEASYVSLDSDGFTLNWTTVQASATYVWAISLKGGGLKVGSFNKPTATGNSAVTGVGFQPVGEFFWSFGDVAATTVADRNGKYSYGLASSSTARGTWGTSGTANANRSKLSRTLALTIDDAGTVVGDADFVSQDADGFTLNWTTADATARQILYLAFGNGAAAASAPPRHIRVISQAVNRASSF